MFERHSPKKRLSFYRLRVRLAKPEALTELTLLGIVTGVFAGGLLIGFREVITLMRSLSPLSGDDDFSTLAPVFRFLLPIAGALLIIALIRCLPYKHRRFGIAHVIDRLNNHHGQLSVRSILGQFFGAIIALLSGFSIGREGPAVHMGAGAGSVLGQRLTLKDNSLRTLVGCGTAAAISASFNTPMAGVIFAMEVVMREYSFDSFIPVMTAAVVASVMAQIMYGSDPAFIIPAISLVSFHDLLVTAVLAAFIGLLAAGFIHVNLWVARQRGQAIGRPLLLAGVIMGGAGFMLPQVMGLGYSAITAILGGESLSIIDLSVLLLVKLLVTAIVIGLGVPGGVIGPALFIGAAAGALFSLLDAQFVNLSQVDGTFHALTGMVAMMAAVLQAPLAALVTVLEMTRNPHIIMPAMVSIIIACLVVSQCFRLEGLFVMQLKANGHLLRPACLQERLGRSGVASVMDTSFMRSPRYCQWRSTAPLVRLPTWTLLEDDEQRVWLLGTDTVQAALYHSTGEASLDLLNLGGTQRAMPVPLRASVSDALAIMDQYGVDRLYVEVSQNKKVVIVGVITRRMIEQCYS